jgi:LytS/YehU family sensor histidine kinase
MSRVFGQIDNCVVVMQSLVQQFALYGVALSLQLLNDLLSYLMRRLFLVIMFSLHCIVGAYVAPNV